MSNLQPKQFQQLSMFMTAREITDQYAPLKGDRLRVKPDPADMPEHLTGRSARRWERKNTRLETEDELWERKYDEASAGVGADQRLHKGIVNGRIASLRDSLVEQGWMTGHVPLSIKKGDASPKPEIVGAHHRLAVMRKERPDDLLPVIHYKNIIDADNPAFGGYR